MRINQYVCSAAVAIIAIAFAVIIGWLLDITILKCVVPGFPEMKPNTAFSFLLGGAGILTIARGRGHLRDEYLRVFCGGLILVIGGLTLIQYLAQVSVGIDTLLFSAPETSESAFPARMSPHTAFNFIVLGASVISFGSNPRLRKVSEFLALLLSVTTLASVIGLLYGAEALSGSRYVGMALHTAALFFACSVSMLAVNTDSEIGKLVTSSSLGGVAIRRLVPAIVLIPLIIDWLRLEGQERGLFDQRFGSALLQFSRIVIMGWLVLVFSRATHRMDTRRTSVEHDLKVNEKRYHDLFEYSQGMICIHDLEGTLKTVNPAVLRSLGYESHEIVGRNLVEFMPAEKRSTYAAFFRKLENEGLADGVFNVISRTGRQLTWRYHSVLVTEEGEDPYVIGHAQDITELASVQEQLKNLALTDELTGLYNRRGFLTMADQQIKLERHQRTARGLALMFADIDGLKRINDKYGHDAGSDAILALATAIRSALRGADLVARWGGDEFVILAIGSRDEDSAVIAERIQGRIRDYNATSGKPYDLACSIGLAELPLDGSQSLDAVLADADYAMYHEKRRRKATADPALSNLRGQRPLSVSPPAP